MLNADIAQNTRILSSAAMTFGEAPVFDAEPAAISPAFVHRAAAKDVLVTGWQGRSDTSFSVTVDWSKQHSFFAPAKGSAHHHMLIAQTLRQVALGLTHAEFGVAVGANHFLMEELGYSADPRHRTDAATPVRAEVEYTWTGPRGLHVQIGLQQNGRVFVTSKSRFTWVSDAVYRRLRGARLTARPGAVATPAPVAPSLVGRTAADEVVLGDIGLRDRWELIGDTGHPALIDHAVDHVPGLVLLEAAQQAAYAFAGGRGFNPVSATIQAHRYVEFDGPCRIEARTVEAWSPGTTAVEVVGVQRGATTFRCLVQGSTPQD